MSRTSSYDRGWEDEEYDGDYDRRDYREPRGGGQDRGGRGQGFVAGIQVRLRHADCGVPYLLAVRPSGTHLRFRRRCAHVPKITFCAKKVGMSSRRRCSGPIFRQVIGSVSSYLTSTKPIPVALSILHHDLGKNRRLVLRLLGDFGCDFARDLFVDFRYRTIGVAHHCRLA